jgi:hypothetical protein
MLESLAEKQDAGRLQNRPVLISAGGETLRGRAILGVG